MDILARFAHLEVREKKLPNGRKVRTEAIIFPRYHQLDAVTKVLADVRQRGVGHNYLIEHSAGSGKSNSIAWLAHRLSSLHDPKDQPIFSSVIVITDRLVLDKQLQDTIYQFEHKQGVVAKIDADSAQLAAALNAGTPIIISTLQKFSFILTSVEAKAGRRYAVIVDEAHSSQTGESATNLKKVLGTLEQAEKEEGRDEDQEGRDRGRGPQGHPCERSPAKPLLLRLHGHAEEEDARDVRHPRPGREAEGLPPLLDAAGHRGGLHPRRAQELRDLRHVLSLREGGRGRSPRGQVKGKAGDCPIRLASTRTTSPKRPRS